MVEWNKSGTDLTKIFYLFAFFQNTIDEWMWVFITGAVVYVIPSLFFMIFGSGMVQYWNDMNKSEVKKEDPEKTS